MPIRYYPARRRSAAEQQAAAGGCGCLLLGFLILAAFGSCVGGTTSSSTGPSSSGGFSSDLPTPGIVNGVHRPQVEPCDFPPPVYDGVSCFPGGEQVKVTRVVDGDTVELADRRIVRLLGVDAPEADACAGSGATNFTRGQVEGKWALMYREPGVAVDQYGRELAYLQAPVDISGIYHPATYLHDLGYELVTHGWAEPFADSDANTEFDRTIQNAYDLAQHGRQGMFAPPCGTPEPYNVPNYDYPNPGDGDDGESRLCRGKWYC